MVRRALALFMVLATFFGTTAGASRAFAQQPPPPAGEPDAQPDDESTPSRLSYAEGSVSFWRPGGSDWAPAQVNTPLATGDELYTGHDGNLEVQVGGRAFVRAWGDTQVGLTNQDANFMQLRVTAGHVALDLRGLDQGDSVEIDTPGAAFTIDQPGYYRVDVSPERTSFVTRREGRATITTSSGPGGVVQVNEAVYLDGGGNVQRAGAPEPDVWDRWNDTRTAALVVTTSPSARYVPPQMYGTAELDRYGAWRADPTYGQVWVPATVATGWVPYSTGRWIWDPRFGWTWLDTAPWGWAPYHYGRWVTIGGGWGWAPGPVVVRPVYAPALVAFFGVPGVSVTVGGPSVSWVALGWGEPLRPWWGRPAFVGRPYWAGWGGPRVREVTVYRNVTVVNAVVSVRSDHFGRGLVRDGRVARPDISRLQPVHGRLDIKPEAVSFTPNAGRAARPPETPVGRTVVSQRAPTRETRETVEVPRGGRLEAPRGGRDERPTARGPQQPEGARSPQQREGARGPQQPEGARGPQQREGARGTQQPEGARQAPTNRDIRPEGQHPDSRRDARPDARPAQPAPPAQGKAPADPSARVAPPTQPAPGQPGHPAPTRPAPAPTVPPMGPRPPAMPGPQPPHVEAPRRGEPPRGEPQHPQQPPPPQQQQRGDQRRQQEPPRQPGQEGGGPRSQAPRGSEPRVVMPRPAAPQPEPPRRAAGHGGDVQRRQDAPRVVAPERRPAPAPAARPGAPAQQHERGPQPERGRQER
jgi:Family of unknown function (DUF6600)